MGIVTVLCAVFALLLVGLSFVSYLIWDLRKREERENRWADFEAERLFGGWFRTSGGAEATLMIHVLYKMGMVQDPVQFNWAGNLVRLTESDVAQAVKDSGLTADWERVSRHLENLLSRFQDAVLTEFADQETVTLYRGVSSKEWAKIQEGTHTPRSLESWSNNLRSAAHFGDVRIKAEVPIGQILACHVTLDKEYGQIDHEQEYLVIRNQPLSVERVSIDKEKPIKASSLSLFGYISLYGR